MTKLRIALHIVGVLFTFQLAGTPLFAQTRLGLHVTQQELNIWRDRANRGPYKNKGDVQTNSPGDWTRILENANKFRDNTAALVADRWIPWAGSGCYPKSVSATNVAHTQAGLLKDAAFVYLVKQDASYLPRVKAEILQYIRNPSLNFANRSRWCYVGDQNPGFIVSEVLTRIVFAYDYVRIAGGFTADEQAEFQKWVYNAGQWYSDNIDKYFTLRYVNRLAGDYTLTNYSIRAEAASTKCLLYYGGPSAGFFAQGYNNRLATCARFMGVAGVVCNNVSLQTNAKRFFFEWMRYGVYPNGEIADLHRGFDDLTKGAESGLMYSFGVAQVMSDLADLFARKGDASLYNYSTEEGCFGSQSTGNPKNLFKVITNLQKYLNGTFKRYASKYSTTNANFLINGIDPFKTPGEISYDIWFSMANVFYNSSFISSNYRRQAAGCRPYPQWPRSVGSNYPFGGHAAVYPGSLFMFGQMEGKTWPYAANTNQAPSVSMANPGNGTSFLAGTSLTVTANATDKDGQISNVEFFLGNTSLGIDYAAPYTIAWNNALAGVYALKAVVTDEDGASAATVSNVTINALPGTCSATGTILREYWSNVSGIGVSAIPVTRTPNSTSQLTSFQGPKVPAGAWGVGDNYGARYRGYVCVPTTGNYTFWIASDNDGELWLSTDANPANRRRIAYIQNGFAYITDWTKYASQKSVLISLVAGKKYYIEALHKEAAGGDNLAVGWQLPNGTFERPIPGSRLSPFSAANARTEDTETVVEDRSVETPTSAVLAFPNPFDNLLTLQWTKEQPKAVTVTIIDSYTRIRYQQQYQLEDDQNQLALDMSQISLAPGIYYLSVQSARGKEVIRLLKQ
ncbi:MAG: Ig-like domain-containing protein [Bacteroidota bacterium]